MEKILEAFGAVIVVLILVAVSAFIGGTLVFLLWPVAVPAVFPGLIASGILAAKITWWQAICVSWLAGLLIKGTTTINKGK